ncbi:MAG: hypothetical protein WCJ95_03230 [Mariniphaga sp.]
MQKIKTVEALRVAIIKLETRQVAEEKLLRDQFFVTYESLKPVNVIRAAINEFLTLSDLKEPLIETTAGIITGYLSRVLITRNSKNPLLRISGIIAQYGITNLVSKNSTKIVKVALRFIQSLTSTSKNG